MTADSPLGPGWELVTGQAARDEQEECGCEQHRHWRRSEIRHRRVTIEYNDGQERVVVIDASGGVRITDGIAHFGRTEPGSRWAELVAAPLTSIHHWH